MTIDPHIVGGSYNVLLLIHGERNTSAGNAFGQHTIRGTVATAFE